MVTSTGDFEYEQSAWELPDPREWHFPLPRIHWRPKVKDNAKPGLVTRYTHTGSHRKADPVRASRNVTWRLFTIALAIYHYAVVAFILKDAEAAAPLLVTADIVLAAAIGSGVVWQYLLRRASKPVVKAVDIVYVTAEEARGGYGEGDTAQLPLVRA